MQNITINQPKKLVVGQGSMNQLVDVLKSKSPKQLFIVTDPHVAKRVLPIFETLNDFGIKIGTHISSGAEPTFSDLEEIIGKAREQAADFVIGIGGGSVLDIAKLVAALINVNSPISAYIGNGLIKERKVPLICVPTTSGAGSESSPNAILIDESDNSKKGIIDAVLMPDEVYIDPTLLTSLPPNITAYTGLDALTHCIEAYANKFAHPVVDVYALEGIRLISQNLGAVIANGDDLEARTKVALGAYYGGMCLGPVNTAAVHALAYPLGTKFKIAHGLSNALLLPFVLEYNLSHASARYAAIALAMGGEDLGDEQKTAEQGIALIRKLIQDCGMPARLSELNITLEGVNDLAEGAMLIQRLLKNNVRDIAFDDAVQIYKNAF
jgi:alcohol dehydrogenase